MLFLILSRRAEKLCFSERLVELSLAAIIRNGGIAALNYKELPEKIALPLGE